MKSSNMVKKKESASIAQRNGTDALRMLKNPVQEVADVKFGKGGENA